MVSIESGGKTNETEIRNDGKGSTVAIDLEVTVRTDGEAVMIAQSAQSAQSGEEVMTAGRIVTNSAFKKIQLWAYGLL